MQKIRKGDEIIVIAGKDKGRRGAVVAVLEEGEKFLIEGVNLIKKHVKANPNINEQGGIKTKPAAIHRSKVKIYNAATQKGDRVGIRVLEDGRKVRYFKSTNEEIEV
jgi:large subunit ribosomal protein L24